MKPIKWKFEQKLRNDGIVNLVWSTLGALHRKIYHVSKNEHYKMRRKSNNLLRKCHDIRYTLVNVTKKLWRMNNV